MQPAHETKHIPFLHLPYNNTVFVLAQLDNGQHNGTAIWLSGQTLAVSLPSLLSKSSKCRRAIELGSGIGFTALGWDVVATDTRAVLNSVLQRNIDTNRTNLPPGSGSIQARELDWTVDPLDWTWSDNSVIASHDSFIHSESPTKTLAPPFDLILTADTLYSSQLVTPLLRTLKSLSLPSSPPIYLTLERRDSRLADDALRQARETWSLSVQQIPNRKITKAIAKAGCGWDRAAWESVEIWRLFLQV